MLKLENDWSKSEVRHFTYVVIPWYCVAYTMHVDGWRVLKEEVRQSSYFLLALVFTSETDSLIMGTAYFLFTFSFTDFFNGMDVLWTFHVN